MRPSSLLLLALAGCGGGVDAVIPEDVDRVPFTSLNPLFGSARLTSQWSGGRSRQSLKDQAAWATVHMQATGQATAPTLDLASQSVLFAAMGSRLSTGFDVVIDEILKDPSGRLYVRVREVVPGPGCGTQGTPTSPVTAVLTIREYTAVTWVESVETNPCTSASAGGS